MKFKTLTNNDELLQYSQLTDKYIDVKLPLEYLQKSRVVACINNHGYICGGFVIVLKGPFRVIESIPSINLGKWEKQLNDCAEVTGLWFDSSHSAKRASIRFWLQVYYELLTTKRKYFTYAWSLKKPKLGEIYSFTSPTILFRGETKLLPGMDKPDQESVEIMRRRNLFFVPLLRPDFIFKRIRGQRKSKKHNVHRQQVITSHNYL